MTMRRYRHIAAVLLSLGLAACGNRQPQSDGTEAVGVSVTRHCKELTPPAMLEGQDAVEYMLDHCWDFLADTSGLWLSDSLHLAGVPLPEIEQTFANYSFWLDSVPDAMAVAKLRSLYARLRDCFGARDFDRFMDVAKRYLYDPNSPLRNEDFWQPLAAALAADPLTPPELRDSYAYEARTCLLNRRGTPAADFRWSDRDGVMHRLYDINADHILLFFSNPGCTACKEIMEKLGANPYIGEMIDGGELAVVNVYIDEDVEAWYGYMAEYPDNWYNGYDPDLVIRTDLLYNVRAIPSLYVLDADKRVVLKDAPENRVIAYLENLR